MDFGEEITSGSDISYFNDEICSKASSKITEAEPNFVDKEDKGSVGRWTNEEHQIFLKGCEEHGKDWKLIADLVGTRTVVQTRTHAQKYFQKKMDTKDKSTDSGSDMSISTDQEGGSVASTVSIAASPNKKRKNSAPRVKKASSATPSKKSTKCTIKNMDTTIVLDEEKEDEFYFSEYCDLMNDLCNDGPVPGDVFGDTPLFESFNRERAFSDLAPPLLPPMLSIEPLQTKVNVIRPSCNVAATFLNTVEYGKDENNLAVKRKVSDLEDSCFVETKPFINSDVTSSGFMRIVTPTEAPTTGDCMHGSFFKGDGAYKQEEEGSGKREALTIKFSVVVPPPIVSPISPHPVKKQRGRPRKHHGLLAQHSQSTHGKGGVYAGNTFNTFSSNTFSSASADSLDFFSAGTELKQVHQASFPGNQNTAPVENDYELFPTDSLESFLFD